MSEEDLNKKNEIIQNNRIVDSQIPNTSQPTNYEKWMLSLDQYIDVKYHPKVKRYGSISAIALFFITFCLGLTKVFSINFIANLQIFMIMSMVAFGNLNKLGWINKRQVNKKYRPNGIYDCGCCKEELPEFGERGWLEARKSALYQCIVYTFVMRFFITWLVLIFIVFFGFYLLSRVFKVI